MGGTGPAVLHPPDHTTAFSITFRLFNKKIPTFGINTADSIVPVPNRYLAHFGSNEGGY